jgi:hypothetical protein
MNHAEPMREMHRPRELLDDLGCVAWRLRPVRVPGQAAAVHEFQGAEGIGALNSSSNQGK